MARGRRPASTRSLVAAHIATALQTIVSRNIAPVDTAVLSITQIHAGDAYNVIPQTATLGGTVRAFSREVMAQLEAAIRRVAKGVAEGLRRDRRGRLPRALRTDGQRRRARPSSPPAICTELVGADKVERDPTLIMASEDFSFMLEKVPGCYLNIGNGLGEGGCEVHNPAYDFNDAALPLGAAFFARAVETRLARR